MTTKIEMIIPARVRDIEGFPVHRVLPYAKHRMIGPFIFLDHMGPKHFRSGEGLDVRPHPHIGLATVTYLFSGTILHRDSLGSHQLIEPGAINWMVAGKGIAHSERVPPEIRQHESDIHGLQCWVALPQEHEDTEPSFTHYPAKTIPEFEKNSVRLRVLAGNAFGYQSPTKTFSDMFYVEARMPKGSVIQVPSDGRELGIYLVDGAIRAEDQSFQESALILVKPGEDLEIHALADSRVMFLGGAPLESPRKIWWNFVSSSEEKIEKAKADWQQQRFAKIPGDDQEFVPLPIETVRKNPAGTIM